MNMAEFLHGNLVRVFNTGVVLLGPAGIGKTELTLELIDRGHQFCADDNIELSVRENNCYGKAINPFKQQCYLRHFGLINIANHYGENAYITEIKIELIIHLKKPIMNTHEINSLTPTFIKQPFANLTLAQHELIIAPYRHLALYVERIAKQFELNTKGHHHAETKRYHYE